MRESRRLQRTRYSAEQHFDALDADADELETMYHGIKEDLKTIRATLVGLLVTIAGAAVIGALNLLFRL